MTGNRFKKLKIRAKLLLAFGSVVFVSVLLTVFAIYSIRQIIIYKNLNEDIATLSAGIDKMELSVIEFVSEGYKETDFQKTGQCALIRDFYGACFQVQGILKQLERNNLAQHWEIEEVIPSIHSSVDHLTVIFTDIKKLLKARGFKDHGLEGSLRESIHQIEKSSSGYDKYKMLILRRHEKDFFLRRDLKYQKEFNVIFESFKEGIVSPEIISLANNYQTEFNKVVEIEQQIGLTVGTDKRGELKSELLAIRSEIELLKTKIKEMSDDKMSASETTITIIFFVQFIIGMVLAVVYSNGITKPIKEIKQAMCKLAAGTFPNKLAVHSTEEIGETKNALNQFMERLRVATIFSQKLGTGELRAVYDSRYSDDVLAKAIINMQKKLQEADDRQFKINWFNEGMARFNDLLKNETGSIHTLGDSFLRLIVEYMCANQAALYIIDGEKKILRTGIYLCVWEKRYEEQRVEVGSGLVGQCAWEKDKIHLKEIPNDYLKITSGLGEATPKNILLVPLKIREEVNGVLEMGSFKIFEEHQIRFVEKMAESIAFIIYNRQINQQTKFLLEESQKQTIELKQQEEEMRQNSEELMAIQEHMERQKMEVQKEITRLKILLQQEDRKNFRTKQQVSFFEKEKLIKETDSFQEEITEEQFASL